MYNWGLCSIVCVCVFVVSFLFKIDFFCKLSIDYISITLEFKTTF